MFLFENDKCPVCNEEFKAEDDVVVCPVCGTPHHRECYNKTHRCANREYHNKDFKFERSADVQQEEKAEQEKPAEKQPLPFMPVIDNKSAEEAVKQLAEQAGEAENKKEEVKVDGVSVYDVSQVIGSNVRYYLPRFVRKKGLNWNWGAFFFGPLYYFFRKMYMQGFLFLALNFASNIVVSTIYSKQINAFYSVYNAVMKKGNAISPEDVTNLFNSAEFSNYLPAMLVMGAVSLVLAVVMGICANRMYRKKVIGIVKTVDEKLKQGDSFAVNPMFMGNDMNLSQADLRKLFLSKQGGVSWAAPLLVYGLMMMLSIM